MKNFAEREYKKKFLEAFRRKYGKNAKFSVGYMCIFAVTPLAGVGIEIRSALQVCVPATVTPLAGVGIEIFAFKEIRLIEQVTPLAGVGIEIGWPRRLQVSGGVTPLAGVGIEIQCSSSVLFRLFCHPPRGGGN